VNLSSPVTLNGDFWVVMRGDPKWTGEDVNMDYDNAGSSDHSYGSNSGVAGLSPSSVGNYMLRATLQEGDNGDGAYNYFLAAIAHTPGVGDALWRSKVGVLNRSGSSADVTLTYYWKNGPTAISKSIFNGRLETWDDAAVSLFGISSKSSGSVLINSTKPLVVTARTYNVGKDGSFGSFMPGVTAADGVSRGELGILSQLTGNNDFRTNVGLVNLSNKTCQARVRVISASGATHRRLSGNRRRHHGSTDGDRIAGGQQQISNFEFRISNLLSASGRRVAPLPAGGSWPPPPDEA